MTLKIFSIRDSKTDHFNTPFFNRSVGEAERNFEQLVNDGKSTVYLYPTDYDLYELGSFDDNSGKFETFDTPRHLIKAVQLHKSEAQAQV